MPETAPTAPPAFRPPVALPMSPLGRVLDVLDRWHDDHHGIGQRRHCHDQPCRDITLTLDLP